jgi:hypothetical protein
VSAEATIPRHRYRRHALRPWLIFLLTLVVLYAAKRLLDREHEGFHVVARDHYLQYYTSAAGTASRYSGRLQAFIAVHHMSTEDVATDLERATAILGTAPRPLPAAAPAAFTRMGHEVNYVARIPGTPLTFYLSFDRGRLVDINRTIDPIVEEEESAVWVTAEWIRYFVFHTAVPLGILMLIGAAFAARTDRFLIARAALAVALVAIAAAFAEPSPPYFRHTLPRPLGFAFGLATVSLVLAIGPPRPPDLRYCRRCRYDLTGNQSGVCPECGLPTLQALRARQLNRFAPYAEALEHLTLDGSPSISSPAALQ